MALMLKELKKPVVKPGGFTKIVKRIIKMTKWIEEYQGCGCSIGPVPFSDLVGYCAIHGGDVIRCYRVGNETRVAVTKINAPDVVIQGLDMKPNPQGRWRYAKQILHLSRKGHSLCGKDHTFLEGWWVKPNLTPADLIHPRKSYTVTACTLCAARYLLEQGK
jgi:hypothetical protein